MKKIVVIGGGVLGSQIAFQTAYCGFDVTVWLRNQPSVKKCQLKLDELKKTYINTIKLMAKSEGKSFNNWSNGISSYEEFDEEKCLELVHNAYKTIKLETNLKEILDDADLVIESLPENLELKRNFFKTLSSLLPQKTIVVTNSSTILPSKMSKYTSREDKFMSLHFANSIWKNNITEIMGQSKTNQKYFDEVMEFAKNIKMVPLPVKKEKSGYLLNSMLIPLLFSALDLYVNGISDFESIDKAWTLGTGSPKGPFQILDTVGLNTAYNIVIMYVKIPSFLAPYNFKGMEELLKKYVKSGKVGIASGEGFYKYI